MDDGACLFFNSELDFNSDDYPQLPFSPKNEKESTQIFLI